MTPRLQRLRAEIASDLRAFESRIEELGRLPSLAEADRAPLAEAAVALHHAYGAVEAALARIARAVDDGVPEGPEWPRPGSQRSRPGRAAATNLAREAGEVARA